MLHFADNFSNRTWFLQERSKVKRFVGLKITLYPSDTVSPITLAMPTTDKTVSCVRCQETAPLTLPEEKKQTTL